MEDELLLNTTNIINYNVSLVIIQRHNIHYSEKGLSTQWALLLLVLDTFDTNTCVLLLE